MLPGVTLECISLSTIEYGPQIIKEQTNKNWQVTANILGVES